MEDGQPGGENMSTPKDHFTHEEIEDPLLHQKTDVTCICPVCRGPLHTTNLVDVKSIVEDNLYYEGGVLLVDCPVKLHCNFEHRYHKEGFTLDEPHNLVAVVEAVFNNKGNCIHFAILEVHSGK